MFEGLRLAVYTKPLDGRRLDEGSGTSGTGGTVSVDSGRTLVFEFDGVFQRPVADFREIWGGKTMSNRHRRAC